MEQPVNWGILGTGDIARQFASDIALAPEARLAGVASRRQETADRFGDAHRVPRRYPAYELMLQDPDIDAVYVATPHPMHCENTLLSIQYGKHVLCEKPFALNARDAERMIAAARARGVFLMEAMWTCFFPAFRDAMRALRDGVIGKPRFVRAEFAFQAPEYPMGRLFDPALGGGSLLDVGIYPVTLAQLVFGGPPREMHPFMTAAPTGVDETASLHFEYPGGAHAALGCSLRYDMPQEAMIAGERGHIALPHRFYQPDTVLMCVDGVETRTQYPRMGYGYHHEIREASRCIQAGVQESPIVPWAQTLAVMQVLDAIRAAWQLHYPME